jgi:hypothetical protein
MAVHLLCALRLTFEACAKARSSGSADDTVVQSKMRQQCRALLQNQFPLHATILQVSRSAGIAPLEATHCEIAIDTVSAVSISSESEQEDKSSVSVSIGGEAKVSLIGVGGATVGFGSEPGVATSGNAPSVDLEHVLISSLESQGLVLLLLCGIDSP